MDLFSWMNGTMDDQSLTSRLFAMPPNEGRSHPGIYRKPAPKKKPTPQVPVEVSHSARYENYRRFERPVTRSMSPLPRRTYSAPAEQPYVLVRSAPPLSGGYSSIAADYYLHPKPEVAASMNVTISPASSPGSPHVDKLSTTTPSTSDHSDVDRSPPRSDYSPNISDNECEGKLLEPVAPLAEHGQPVFPDSMPFSGLIGKGPTSGKPRAARVRTARAFNNCLDGEMRSLEDEMADLTKDLLALKAQVSEKRTALNP